MRKIIISTGYMGSGSSAITDLVSEFEDVNNKHRDFEYIFLHCPNGVFDLEDKLLVGNNSIRSDEAIHSFLKTMKDLYDKKFWWPGYYKKVIGEGFYDEVIRYVDSITDVKSKNYWYYQENPTKKMQIKLIPFVKGSLNFFNNYTNIELNNKLIIEPTPDSLLRVNIHIKKVNKKINIKEQRRNSTKKSFKYYQCKCIR